MKELHFILGENKIINLEIYSTRQYDTVVIKKAIFTLLIDDYIENQGECIIDSNIISAQISPQQIGLYVLVFEFEIGTETFKERVYINAD